MVGPGIKVTVGTVRKDRRLDQQAQQIAEQSQRIAELEQRLLEAERRADGAEEAMSHHAASQALRRQADQARLDQIHAGVRSAHSRLDDLPPPPAAAAAAEPPTPRERKRKLPQPAPAKKK